MKEKLEELINNAYAPYSKFKVAVIIVMKDKKEFVGVNVENVSYGATICAERNAINNAVAYGYEKGDFKEIHILSSENKTTYPCYLCRQTFDELMTGEEELYMYYSNEIAKFYVKDFLVNSFRMDGVK